MSENKLGMNRNPLIWNMQLFRQMVVIYGKWYSIRRTICCTDVNVFSDFGRPVLSQCFSNLWITPRVYRKACTENVTSSMSRFSCDLTQSPKSRLSESLRVSGPHTLASLSRKESWPTFSCLSVIESPDVGQTFCWARWERGTQAGAVNKATSVGSTPLSTACHDQPDPLCDRRPWICFFFLTTICFFSSRFRLRGRRRGEAFKHELY